MVEYCEFFKIAFAKILPVDFQRGLKTRSEATYVKLWSILWTP